MRQRQPRAGPRPGRAVETFTAALLAGGAEPATALSRQRGVKRFSAWLADEGEIDTAELARMSPPKLDEKVPAELTADQIRALLATCGTRNLHDVRDEAIIRFLVDSMVRSGELLAMRLAGPQTGRALDRYVRSRRRHPLAAHPEMCVSSRA